MDVSHVLNSGNWYHKAWKYLCKEPNDWLCPIIFSCDETLVGSHLGRALNFLLSIFSEEIRNCSKAWRTLGFIYNLGIHGEEMIFSQPNNVTKGRKLCIDEKRRHYHRILWEVLPSYVDV